MLKKLFGGRGAAPVKETQRARYERLITELNAMIDAMPTKPKVTLDPATGHILPEIPDQFGDEALALPSPEAIARTAPKATAPAPRVPEKKIPTKKIPEPRVGKPRIGAPSSNGKAAPDAGAGAEA